MNYDVVNLRGHGNGDVGAVGNGYKEIDVSQIFVDRINELIRAKGVTVLTNSIEQNNYQTCLLKGHNIAKKFGYEIHLNSSVDSSSNGIEIIVPSKEKYLQVEKDILTNICKESGLQNRGLKSRSYDSEQFYFREVGVSQTFTDYYKVIREAWQMGISLSIIELGFISNVNDIKKLLDNKEKICRIIANGILSYCEKEQYPLETSVNPSTDKGEFYYVQVGAFKDKKNAEKLQKELISKGYKAIIK